MQPGLPWLEHAYSILHGEFSIYQFYFWLTLIPTLFRFLKKSPVGAPFHPTVFTFPPDATFLTLHLHAWPEG